MLGTRVGIRVALLLGFGFATLVYAQTGTITIGTTTYPHLQDGLNAIAMGSHPGGQIQFVDHYRETFTSPFDLGGAVTIGGTLTPYGVVLVGGNDVVLTCNVQDSSSGSYCIGIHSVSGLVGGAPWSSGASGQSNDTLSVFAASTMNVQYMVKNRDIPQASMILDRVTINETAAATPPSSCVLIDSLGNMTIFRDTFIYCPGPQVPFENTGVTATESGTTVTLSVSPSWSAAVRLNGYIRVTACTRYREFRSLQRQLAGKELVNFDANLYQHPIGISRGKRLYS